jgi:hypothetical protein
VILPDGLSGIPGAVGRREREARKSASGTSLALSLSASRTIVSIWGWVTDVVSTRIKSPLRFRLTILTVSGLVETKPFHLE